MTTKRQTDTAPRWQPSLRLYLILMFVFLLCLLLPTISIYYFQKTSSFRDEQLARAVAVRTAVLKDKAAQLTRSMSHIGTQAIAEFNFTFLNDVVQNSVRNDTEFIGCQFVSQASPAGQPAGYGFMGIDEEAYAAFRSSADAEKILVPELTGEGRLLPIAYIELAGSEGLKFHPGLIAVAPVYIGNRLWGTVNATFSLEQVDRDIMKMEEEWARQMRKYSLSFLTITLIFVGTGIMIAIVLTRPLLRSISLLRDGVEKVSRGDLEHEIVSGGLACDEFVVLSRSFNEMTGSLRQARKQLDAYSRSLEEQISERTRELREAQAELLLQAHEAGMAEMAVGVLHNIGNAITPVKVATHLLSKRLREHPLRTNLKDALHTIPDEIQSVPGMTEEKKQKITMILKLLPQGIRDEFDHIIREIEQISEKHRYIENVINLQMNYARLKGRDELVDINRVAKDALEMLAEVIQKHKVEVKTSLQATAMVRLEEGKLMQILVNLIKNGCEAMADRTDGARKLTVTTSQTPGDHPEVILSVRDTGCGFTPEEQKHFFSFGYSTKNRGTGFGLHSSANYLIANNGTIEAKSEGPGLGAEFIIRLPSSGEIHENS